MVNLNPSPKSGDWYTVFGKDTALMVVLISEEPGKVILPCGLGNGIANKFTSMFQPVFITKNEANIHLLNEMQEIEQKIRVMPTSTKPERLMKRLREITLEKMRSFYEEHF